MIDKMRTMAVSFSLGLIRLLSVLILPAACGQAVISEFLASNQAGLTDEDGEHSDWIEIHNPGARPLPLLGWSLTDDASLSNSWKFPDVTVAAGSRLVVFASAKDRRSLATPLHTSPSNQRSAASEGRAGRGSSRGATHRWRRWPCASGSVMTLPAPRLLRAQATAGACVPSSTCALGPAKPYNWNSAVA